ILPVHYGGQVGDVAGVRELAGSYGLKIIEDAAHCCPAHYRDNGTTDNGPQTTELQGSKFDVQGSMFHPSQVPQPPARDLSESTLDPQPATGWQTVGSGADISCYSFYANKTITTGEGGMACTANDEYADRMRIMSLHGISRDAWKRYTTEGSWYYEIIAPGFKYNMADIAAAIGLQQLRKAEVFHRRRIELAGQYRERLNEVEEIVLPQVRPDRIHSWHLYVIRLKLDRLNIDRAQFIEELTRRGV